MQVVDVTTQYIVTGTITLSIEYSKIYMYTFGWYHKHNTGIFLLC